LAALCREAAESNDPILVELAQELIARSGDRFRLERKMIDDGNTGGRRAILHWA
jgi:hypothetical protein